MNRADQIKNIALDTLSVEADTIITLKNHIDEDFINSVEQIYKTKGKLVVTGIGKSAIIGMKIVATLNSTGTVATFMHAADAIHGDLGMLHKDDLILCISKSGNSPEIKSLIPHLLDQGAALIGMTADPSSFLGKKATYILKTPIKKEACPNNLAPTSSTTAQLAMGDALAMALLSLNEFDRQDFARFHPGGQLGKELRLTVGDMILQNTRPEVEINTPIREVIHEISDKRLGATAVIQNNKVLGIITDGDIRRMLEKYDSINPILASEIMIKNPIFVTHTMLAKSALQTLKEKNINHLIVCDENEDYLGIVNLLDFIKEGLSR